MTRVFNFRHTSLLQKVLGLMLGLLPGRKPRQEQLDKLFLSATSVEIIDPDSKVGGTPLGTFQGVELIQLRGLLELDDSKAALPFRTTSKLKILMFAGGARLAELDYYVGAVYLPGWNYKAVLLRDDEFLQWLRARGIDLPCSKIPPELASVLDRLRPDMSVEEVDSILKGTEKQFE